MRKGERYLDRSSVSAEPRVEKILPPPPRPPSPPPGPAAIPPGREPMIRPVRGDRFSGDSGDVTISGLANDDILFTIPPSNHEHKIPYSSWSTYARSRHLVLVFASPDLCPKTHNGRMYRVPGVGLSRCMACGRTKKS